jgi:Mg-chelatase subunit ChlD
VLSWAGDTLQRHKGDAFLIGFNDHIAASTAVTADVSQLHLALNQMQPRGGSAVRDAVVQGSEKFNSVHSESQPVARLLVVVCDRHDNASYNEERDAIESLERFGVRMYAIGLPQTGGRSGGKNLLKQLASETGG